MPQLHSQMLQGRSMPTEFCVGFLSSTAFTLLSFSVPRCVWLFVCMVGQLFFVVEYLATQTGGATVNNIFEVRFTYTKID